MSLDDELELMLSDKSTVKRRTAAKRIQKEKRGAVGEALYVAFVEELKLGKYWETEVEMIKALGAIQYTGAEDLLFRICRENKEYDMVTHTSALSYVRLKRASLSDIQPAFVLLAFGKYAVSSGAVAAVGFDKMMPDEQGIKELITRCWDLGATRENGYLDPRYPIAAVCALWPKELVQAFLEHCIDSGDNYLKGIARQALQGKYTSMAQ